MTRVSTRKRNRTPHLKVTRRVANNHQKRKPVAFDPTVAKNWDKTQTLLQNYARLGLSSKLNGVAGGTEGGDEEEEDEQMDRIDLEGRDEAEVKKLLGEGQALVQRDDDGNIIKVIMGEAREYDDGVDLPRVAAKTDTIREMEERAANGRPDDRIPSEGEASWVSKLIAKHGDDYEKMFRDRKLNIYQQTVGQIRKRVIKYLECQKE